VVVNLAHLKSQATVLANSGRLRNRIQLNVLDGVSQSSSATVANSNSSINLDNWDFIHELLGVAAVDSVLVLILFLCQEVINSDDEINMRI
jgi:hypothetical protein